MSATMVHILDEAGRPSITGPILFSLEEYLQNVIALLFHLSGFYSFLSFDNWIDCCDITCNIDVYMNYSQSYVITSINTGRSHTVKEEISQTPSPLRVNGYRDPSSQFCFIQCGKRTDPGLQWLAGTD